VQPIRRFQATNLFGSPALLNRVGRGLADPRNASIHNARTPSLKRVLSAGAPVSPTILERFSKLLSPGTQIYTPYGATEALPVAVIGSDEVLNETRHKTAAGAGTCVGKPVPGIEVRIIRISDEPIPTMTPELVLPSGEIGEIAVYGPQVTQEYFRRPDLTALAKIADPERGRKWHRMGDVGYFDEHGRLWFCGRKSQRVVTPERTHFTEPVEGVFNTHPAVFRTALVGRTRYGVVQPVLCVELENRMKPQGGSQIEQELFALGQQYEHTRAIQKILFHDGFPVDIRHNSKIFREKLAVWASDQVR
jgi:acyl-CoA synthetase (AMP-forming)/AMP-acid ligase II